MPIKIKDGAKVITDARVTPIRVISTLYDNYIAKLKEHVVDGLIVKGASYAESDLVIAQLRSSGASGPVDPVKLYKLVVKGDLSMKQFLSVLSVKKEPLGKLLGQDEIDRLCEDVETRNYIVTEFKGTAEFEAPDLKQLIGWCDARIISGAAPQK